MRTLRLSGATALVAVLCAVPVVGYREGPRDDRLAYWRIDGVLGLGCLLGAFCYGSGPSRPPSCNVPFPRALILAS